MLHNSTNQELFENHHCNQSNENSCYAKETITCYHQINTVSKDEWSTKDTAKLMKNALHLLQYVKLYFSAKVTSNSEKI